MRCFFYQWTISSALDSGRLPGRAARRHMARCEACRDFHEQSLSLGRRLREQAAPAGEPEAARVRIRAGAAFRWARVAAFAAAVAACAAIAVPLLPGPNPPPARQSVVANHPDPIAPRPAPVVPDATLLAGVTKPMESLADAAAEPIRRQVNSIAEEAKAAGKVLISYLSLDTGPRAAGDRPRQQ